MDRDLVERARSVVNAAVIDKGTGYLFYLQHPPEDTSDPEDVGMFRTLLSGVKLP